MRASFFRRTAFARSRDSTATILTCCASTAPNIAWTTSPASPAPDCSAATPTGAGPIWFPVNFLLVESLQKFHHYLGDDFKVEFPTGSGKMMTLWEVAGELSRRMTSIFLRDENGRRPVFGNSRNFRPTPTGATWCCFTNTSTATTGAGVGASHQTGWTGVVTKLMQQSGESRTRKKNQELSRRKLSRIDLQEEKCNESYQRVPGKARQRPLGRFGPSLPSTRFPMAGACW